MLSLCSTCAWRDDADISILNPAHQQGHLDDPAQRLNLMALEEQHPWLGTYVTAYCLLMSQIARTKQDAEVELLEANGVIWHI